MVQGTMRKGWVMKVWIGVSEPTRAEEVFRS